LVLPPEIARQRMLLNTFKKGNKPYNTAKKLNEYLSPAQIEKIKQSQFKKGNKPHNCYNEVGKITIRKDKKGTPQETPWGICRRRRTTNKALICGTVANIRKNRECGRGEDRNK
jgi:hypothetical protein